MTETHDPSRQEQIEAAVFRRLVAHLQQRSDVQNIDLMILAGFCRNCLANWYEEAAATVGVAITREVARELVYGMPYDDWKKRFNKEASPEQIAAFQQQQRKADH